MKAISNKNISELSWLSRGGIANNYYVPESIEELVELVNKLNAENRQWLLIGLTSNIYFKNTFSIDNLISTKGLTHWEESEDTIDCECGTIVHLLSKKMVEKGINGFEGLIDLPGTIGGAIYGNAGCFDNSISDLLINVTLLLPDGTTTTLNKDELHFSKRNSDLKRGILKGVILKAKLHKEFGDLEQIKVKAENNHRIRIETQPGPKYNLGSTYCDLGKRTFWGNIISFMAGFYSKALMVFNYDDKTRTRKKNEFEFRLAGGKGVIPYIFSPSRFIWKDDNADNVFIQYQRVLNKLYINPRLEIEIME